MSINQNENDFHVYPVNKNEFIGAVNLSFDYLRDIVPVFILDCSSAVGYVAQRIVKEVLPLLKTKMTHWDSRCRLITFGNYTIDEYLSIDNLSQLNIKCGGEANIAPAIEKLRSYFGRCSEELPYPYHIITISAGEINDRDNAERKLKDLTDVLATSDVWRINSQAVRLITPSNMPDVKALSYMLQINNSTEAKICDINATSSSELIANQIAALFPENVEITSLLYAEEQILSRHPWKSTQLEYLVISNGWNIVWLNQLPSTSNIELSLVSGSQTLQVIVEDQLTLEKFQLLMEKMLPQIVSHLKSLKIVGTTEANKAVDQIFSYFAKTEEALAVKCSTPNTKIITNALAGLAMYRSVFRDSSEMLQFYRNHTKAIEEQGENDRLEEVEEERRLQEEEADAIQTVFIVDEKTPEPNANQRFMENEVSWMLTKHFEGSMPQVPIVKYVWYFSTAAASLKSLARTLDRTKWIRISVLTTRAMFQRQDLEQFAATVRQFLEEGDYSFELKILNQDLPQTTRKPRKQRQRIE